MTENFDAAPELILAVLTETAQHEPLLRAWLGEATWKAAALEERRRHNGQLVAPEPADQ